MNDYRTTVEHSETEQFLEFAASFTIKPFARVQDERLAAVAVVMALLHGIIESQRMSPRKIANDLQREVGRVETFVDRIVMKDGRDSRESIAQASPCAPRLSIECARSFDGLRTLVVDGGRPLIGRTIQAISQAREECELEMIVCVDETRKYRHPREVDLSLRSSAKPSVRNLPWEIERSAATEVSPSRTKSQFRIAISLAARKAGLAAGIGGRKSRARPQNDANLPADLSSRKFGALLRQREVPISFQR